MSSREFFCGSREFAGNFDNYCRRKLPGARHPQPHMAAPASRHPRAATSADPCTYRSPSALLEASVMSAFLGTHRHYTTGGGGGGRKVGGRIGVAIRTPSASFASGVAEYLSLRARTHPYKAEVASAASFCVLTIPVSYFL